MSFTIHFATINTSMANYQMLENYEFTIHFATINTLMAERTFVWCENLQYTLLLLIQGECSSFMRIRWNLQYTLLLLIQLAQELKSEWNYIYNTLCYY